MGLSGWVVDGMCGVFIYIYRYRYMYIYICDEWRVCRDSELESVVSECSSE